MTIYNLTSEDFARARDRLHARRDALAERHRQELGGLEMEIISELDKLDEVERTVAEMAGQSPADRPKPRRKTRNESKAKSARLPPTKYTAEQDAQLLALPADRAAAMNALRLLAVDWRRAYGSLQRRRSELIRERPRAETPTPAEPSSSQTAAISEPTPAALAEAERQEPDMTNSGFRQRTPVETERKTSTDVKPGTLTGRLMDNGPGDRRMYGRGFESAGRE